MFGVYNLCSWFELVYVYVELQLRVFFLPSKNLGWWALWDGLFSLIGFALLFICLTLSSGICVVYRLCEFGKVFIWGYGKCHKRKIDESALNVKQEICNKLSSRDLYIKQDSFNFPKIFSLTIWHMRKWEKRKEIKIVDFGLPVFCFWKWKLIYKQLKLLYKKYRLPLCLKISLKNFRIWGSKIFLIPQIF